MSDRNPDLAALFQPPHDADTRNTLLETLSTPARLAPFIDFVMRELLPRDHHSVFWGDRMLTLDKAMGFLDDPHFRGVWEKVRGAHVYDQYDNSQSIAWRMHTLVWAARHALALPEGDLVECGVFQGDMSFVVYHAAGVAGSGRHMHLFDSFEGIDPARVTPGEYGRSHDYVNKANAFYQRPGLYESVAARFAPCPEVSVHKGFLPEALDGKAPEKIAWLHIDLNAARAEVETLEVLFDRVVPSGIVIFDDYGWLVLDSQKKAEDAFFAARGYSVLELPTGQGLVVKRPRPTAPAEPRQETAGVKTGSSRIDLDRYRSIFDSITPWAGEVAGGYTADFLGILTRHKFLPLTEFPPEENQPRYVETAPPPFEIGEIWFEVADWVEAARAARVRFTMVTLGANYGAQAVGAAKALMAVNPMPYKLVAVEPVPENLLWTAEHMRDNGIDPDDHWLLQTAIGGRNAPVLFPVGSPGSGAQNSYATNEAGARAYYADELVRSGRIEEALRSLLLANRTGLQTNLVEGYDLPADIEMVSAVTLREIIAPLDIVDLLESDIQQSEILVFPPCVDFLKKKVRRIHIGTHGADVHRELRDLFAGHGWEMIFDFAPNSRFHTSLGDFETNDGILTLRNPDLT